MKKIAFMFVAVAAMAFAACTENKPAEAATDAAAEAVEEVVDSAAAAVEEVADSAAAAVDAAADATPEAAQ